MIAQTLLLMSGKETPPPPNTLRSTTVPTMNIKEMEGVRFRQVTHTDTNRWPQMEARLAVDERRQRDGCPWADHATCQDSPFSEGAAKAFSGLKYDMDAARRRKGPGLSILGGVWNHGWGRRGGGGGERDQDAGAGLVGRGG